MRTHEKIYNEIIRQSGLPDLREQMRPMITITPRQELAGRVAKLQERMEAMTAEMRKMSHELVLIGSKVEGL